MALIGIEGEGTWPAVTTERGPGVKEYKTEINGVEATLLLSDEDAEARGLTAKVETKQRTPANKAAPKKTAKE